MEILDGVDQSVNVTEEETDIGEQLRRGVANDDRLQHLEFGHSFDELGARMQPIGGIGGSSDLVRLPIHKRDLHIGEHERLTQVGNAMLITSKFTNMRCRDPSDLAHHAERNGRRNTDTEKPCPNRQTSARRHPGSDARSRQAAQRARRRSLQAAAAASDLMTFYRPITA